ncbi:MAG: AraC family chitin signaling transcriptional activator [Mariniflexile sp.]
MLTEQSSFLMTRIIVFIIFLSFLTPLGLKAQVLPPIQVYSPEIYEGDNQNWSISQSKEKFIYVANNLGLLEFNGAKWKLHTSPSGIIRAINVIDNLIYSGSYREFGFWKKDEFGALSYSSLSTKLKVEFLDDEEFWGIVAIDDWILFQSLKRIYIYNKKDNTYAIINSKTDIYKIFKINESIYFQKAKDGLYKIENGETILVSNAPEFKDNLLVNIFNYGNSLLVETENNGFYLLNKGVIKVWNNEINKKLEGVSVYRSIQLSDKSIVIGTRSDGIFQISLEGQILQSINITNGLSNNTIHYIYEDVDKNIWLALENGINCVNITSAFSVYNDKNGKIGTVYASAVFNNYLYLGTNQGLFFKSLNSNDDFQLIKGTEGVVRCLVGYDNTLFCGHNIGTFIVNNNSAELAIDIEGTWNIIPIKNKKNLLLQGGYKGLNIIEKKNGSWTLRNKIDGFNASSRFFEITKDNEILVSHEYDGVYVVKIDSGYTKAINFTKNLDVGKGLKSSLVKHNNELFYTYKEGVFKYNETNKQFKRDSLLSKLFTNKEYSSGKLISDSKNNILWLFSKNDLNYVAPGKLSNKPQLTSIAFPESLPRGLTGYENISHLNTHQYLIGASTGYVVVDLDKFYKKNYSISINSIIKNKLNSARENVTMSDKGVFENEYNNIELSYSVAQFDKYAHTEYQYQLKGMYPDWSDWTTNSTILFKNLAFGDYVFNVRARVGNSITNNVSSYNFKIEKPWHLSSLMIIFYSFLLLLFSFIMHNVYKIYYKKQREKFAQEAFRKLELKELENKQQLMRFNNDKLRQDIENKNRELGISTMSLIKKNEFLNNIKKELNRDEGGQQLKQVIKIIDRNLNNTDDWNLFEEAFNNADQDFLKKIKLQHPSLTSNDLRLCAYLRLNLSSKEIAPLLNISSRSVEVKRYRLRKKMNLAHDASLTDYILET